MIHNKFPLPRKSTSVWLGILAGILFLTFGCGGGGGGGGAQPLITPENKIPTASISSPTGTQFNEGENIAFGGSATDEEDGPLDGAALVWASNIDGTIGTGTALTTSVLTAGDHEITLTATDSEGGVHTTAPTLIHIEQTRFIKMGTQTTGVTDAANAFDGDHDTSATIVTPDTEFIHFKAFIGGADTFQFNIKVGASTVGSKLAIQGLYTGDTTWRPVSDIGLTDTENTVTVKLSVAEDYKDTQGYINLRVRWEGGGGEDSVSIFELWRIDPIYAGPQSTGANDSELAFDGDPTTGATIITPWDGNAPFLHFKAYVGMGAANTFAFNISHNNIGPTQSLAIEVEDLATATPPANNWIHLESFNLDSEKTRTLTVSNVQNYLDDDGYIRLRAFWVGFGAANQMTIYEISRIDPFFVGTKTPETYVTSPKNAVDNNDASFAVIYYSWGEMEGDEPRHDFLHIKSYAGDESECIFSFQAATSAPGSNAEMIVEGETEPDIWSEIERTNLSDSPTETIVRIVNAREYVDANGELSFRFRWESDSVLHDAHIYDIQRK